MRGFLRRSTTFRIRSVVVKRHISHFLNRMKNCTYEMYQLKNNVENENKLWQRLDSSTDTGAKTQTIMAKNSELSVLIRWRRSTRSCTISGVIVNSSKKECFELFQFLTVTLEEGMNFPSIQIDESYGFMLYSGSKYSVCPNYRQ